MGMFLLLDHS